MEIPPHWPVQVSQQYEPVRLLGKGGFGSVILARAKNTDSNTTKDDSSNLLVALKAVGSSTATVTDQDIGYAHREVDILAELSHRNIMRLLQHYESENHLCVMALSYASGVTVEELLQTGGRLSLPVARVLSAQLIDAVYYLHSRAVIHRDIKPANLVVTGATLQDDFIWDADKNEQAVDWSALLEKYHLTLIDFGLARALTPYDIQQGYEGDGMVSSERSISSASPQQTKKILKLSSFRSLKKKMSALGTKDYSAPEIFKGIQLRTAHSSVGSADDVTKTISEYVSSYGFMVDEYAIGSTMKYMLTGAPPNISIDELVDAETNIILLLFRCFCSSKKNVRYKQYRYASSLPPEVNYLVRGLMQQNPSDRTSVRAARRLDYISAILDKGPPPSEKVKISFLNIVLAHDNSMSTRVE